MCRKNEGGWPRLIFLIVPQAILCLNVQRVFSRFVRETGNRTAVGRPGRVAFLDAGGSSDVPNIPLLGGNRQDLTVRLEDRPLAPVGEICAF